MSSFVYNPTFILKKIRLLLSSNTNPCFSDPVLIRFEGPELWVKIQHSCSDFTILNQYISTMNTWKYGQFQVREYMHMSHVIIRVDLSQNVICPEEQIRAINRDIQTLYILRAELDVLYGHEIVPER